MAMESSESRTWYIYCHTAPNGKRYIGKTCQQPERRWSNGKGYVSNKYFTRAIKKYGWDNIKHDVLCTVSSREYANYLEQWFIEKYDTFNSEHGFNLTKGGDGGLGHRVSQETRALLSKRALDRGMTPEHLEKMHEGRRKNGYRRRPMTEEEKKALGDRVRGENHPWYGKKLPREIVEKRTETVRGRKASEETRRNQSIGLRNSEKVKAKMTAVLQIDDDGNIVGRFQSISDAAREMGVTKQAIRAVCNGTCCSACGYGWQYEDPERRKKAEQKAAERTDKDTIGLPVVQLDLNGNEIARYRSTVDASHQTDIPRYAITNCCRGRLKTSHGYIWRYLETPQAVQQPLPGLFH